MRLGRGYTWLDTGTHESLASASDFVRILEQRQGLKIGCPEEIAFAFGYINAEQVLKIAKDMGKTDYAEYLRDLVDPEESCNSVPMHFPSDRHRLSSLSACFATSA